MVHCSVYLLTKRAANRFRSKISLRKMRIRYVSTFYRLSILFSKQEGANNLNRGPVYGFRAFYDDDMQE